MKMFIQMTVKTLLLGLCSCFSSLALDAWPVFRGDQGLTGIAGGHLPDRPELLWSFTTGDEVTASPVTDGKTVFVGSGDGTFYAIHFLTGKKVWSFPTEDSFEGAALLLDSVVYVANLSGTLYALEAASGKEKWRFKAKGKITGSPNYVTGRDGKGWCLLVTGYDNRLHGIDSSTGKALWSYDAGNFINGSAAVSDGFSVFGGCDARLHVVKVPVGEGVRQINGLSYIAGSAAISGTTAWFGNHGGDFLSVDVSGKREAPLWTFKGNDDQAGFFSSPAVTKDRVLIGSRDTHLYCLSRREGKELWRFKTKGGIDSSPVVCGNKVVTASTDGRIYLLDLVTGKRLWRYEVGDAITSSPAVCDGRIIVGCNDGRVYAFGMEPPILPGAGLRTGE